MSARPLVAGNWKMNLLRAPARALAEAVAAGSREVTGVDVAIFPPLTSMGIVREALRGSAVQLGAQACHDHSMGAHTGEVSAEMLADAGCRLVLCGHSERRAAGESDAAVGARVHAALRAGLVPVLCVGETLDEREGGHTEMVLRRQLDAGLEGVEPDALRGVELAYEPVWAIGTGRHATPALASEAHAFLRSRLVGNFGDAGTLPRILYGGSVNARNAAELLAAEGVGGVLVGGASLDAVSFVQILRAATPKP